MDENPVKEIYKFLLEEYGPQGWWPVTPIGSCSPYKPIYGISPKNERQKFEVIVGAILTQNTSWKNVEKAIMSLNRHGLLDCERILRVNERELAQTIRASGYYNQKAKRLKTVCRFLKHHPIRKLTGMRLWDARKLLLGINGIGPETADSILLYALNKPTFVVDAYTRRIFARLCLIKVDAKYEEIQAFFMKNLPQDAELFNEYHALLVQHAKQFYKGNSSPDNCPMYKRFSDCPS